MRNIFLVIIATILLGPTAALAHDVLVVQGLRVKPFDEAFRGFRETCDVSTKRVYIHDYDGQNFTQVVRQDAPRLILAIGADALTRVQKIKGIPIVYLMVLNPGAYLHGNGNATGIDMNVPAEKYLDILAQMSPSPKTVGIVYDPAKTGDLVQRAKRAAAPRGIAIRARSVGRANDVPRALDSLKDEADALLLLPDTTVVTPESIESFLLFSQKNSVPVVAFAGKYVEMGALLSLDIDGEDMGRQAGELASRVLKGTSVSALPRAEARTTHLKVNRNVAKKLGIALFAGDR
jgi:putative ABC transport system substrate-binding protein